MTILWQVRGFAQPIVAGRVDQRDTEIERTPARARDAQLGGDVVPHVLLENAAAYPREGHARFIHLVGSKQPNVVGDRLLAAV